MKMCQNFFAQDKDILQSRVKLLYAHYKLIHQDGELFIPTLPLLLYKHHVQLRYNQGKPGLDKNTEMALRVHSKHPSSFETKYVFTLLDRILINAWRAEVAVNVIKPWLTKMRKQMKERPSFTQVRRKVQNDVTIDDFVEFFSIIYLQFLEKHATSPSPRSRPSLNEVSQNNVLSTPTNVTSNSSVMLTRKDQEVLAVIDTLKAKKEWQKKRDSLKQFLDNPELDKLRTHSSNGVKHCPVQLDLPTKESRKHCVLCKKGKDGRNTTHYCSICLVPLCVTILRGVSGEAVAMSCFQRFHQCVDLKRQASRSYEWLSSSRGHDNRVMNF